MAGPKLQIEWRIDRQERAISMMAQQLLNPENAEEIERILRGDRDAIQESSPEEMGVRSEGSGMGQEAPFQQQGTASEESDDKA